MAAGFGTSLAVVGFVLAALGTDSAVVRGELEPRLMNAAAAQQLSAHEPRAGPLDQPPLQLPAVVRPIAPVLHAGCGERRASLIGWKSLSLVAKHPWLGSAGGSQNSLARVRFAGGG